MIRRHRRINPHRRGGWKDQYWINTAAFPTAYDRLQYGYDRDGDVLYENNLVNAGFSELFHNNSAAAGDNNTAYDALGRLTAMRRGTLSASGHNGSGFDTVTAANLNITSGLTGNQKAWSLDAVGNWNSVTTDGAAATRTSNSQNQITGQTGVTTPTYDKAGDLLTDEQGATYTYNAWGEVVKFVGTGSAYLYQYDAMGRQSSWTTGGTASANYFSGAQVIEERNASIWCQYVWGLGYVNDLVLRDRNADHNSATGGYGLNGDGLDEREYAQQDANWNVISLTSGSGRQRVRTLFQSGVNIVVSNNLTRLA